MPQPLHPLDQGAETMHQWGNALSSPTDAGPLSNGTNREDQSVWSVVKQAMSREAAQGKTLDQFR